MVNDATSRRSTTEKTPISRSTRRDTLSNQTTKIQPSSTSKLLHKRTPPTLEIGNKSEKNKKLKMTTTPSPLRRSERNKNSSSPFSIPSPSNSVSPALKKQDDERKCLRGSSKLLVKKLDARGYRKAFKTQNKDYYKESNSLDKSTCEDDNRGGGKIDECSKADSLHPKAIPEDVTLPPEDANAIDMCAESRLGTPEKELLENDATLDSTVPCNATTHETNGEPERVQPDLHGKVVPQILASRNSSDESLIRKCVGQDNVENMTTSKRKSTLVDKCSDTSPTLVDDENNNVIVDAGPSSLCCNIVETSGSCSKRIRGVSLSGEQKDQRKFINDVDQPCPKSNNENSSAREKEGTYGDSLEGPQANNVETEKIRKQQRSLHLSLKPEIAKLCEILLLPDNVKNMVEKFLEYTINNYKICTEPVSILQAFQLSLCWTITSLLSHKLDFSTSLMLAKQHLDFDCKKDMVNEIKARLWDLKDGFLLLTGNSEVIGSPKASETSDTVHSNTEVIEKVELTEKDISRNIKENQERKRQWRKLLHMQQEFKQRLEKQLQTEKADFGRRCKLELAFIRSGSSNDVTRTEKLKKFQIECGKRNRELERQHEVSLKDIEANQLEARRKLQESWALGDLSNPVSSNEFGTPDNAPIVLLPDHVAEGKNFDNRVKVMTRNGTEAGFSEAPNTNSSVIGQDTKTLFLPPFDRDICDGGTSNVPNAEVVPAVHKTISSNDDSSRQGNGFIDGVKNTASSNSQSPEECMQSVNTMSKLNCKDAAQINEADDRNASNNASTLDSPLSDENSESGVNVTGTSNGQISAQLQEGDEGNGSNNVVNLKLPPDNERTGDGNVLDRDREVHVEMPTTANIAPLSTRIEDPAGTNENSESGVNVTCTSDGQISAQLHEGDEGNGSNNVVTLKLPPNNERTGDGNVLDRDRDVHVEMPTTANIAPLSTRIEDPAATNEAALTSQIPEASTEVQNQAVEQPPSSLEVDSHSHVVPPENVHQLPSSVLTSVDQDLSNLHMVTRIEDQIPEASNEVQNQGVEQPPSSLDVESHSRQVVVPPASHMDLDSFMPGGVRAQSSETRSLSFPRVINNHPIQTAAQSTSRMVPSLCHDPLSHEWEKIRKRTEQHMKNHEDMKFQMKCDFEKEFEELRRKYEIKFMELDGEFREARQNQDRILKFVYAHKILADALKAKYPKVVQQDAGSPQVSYQLPRQQSASRPSLVATQSPRGPPAASVQNSYATTGSTTPSLHGPPSGSLQPVLRPPPRGPPAASLQTLVRPPSPMQAATGSQTVGRPPSPMQAATGSQTVGRPSGMFSGASANLQAGGEIRAPAPHLQLNRPLSQGPPRPMPTIPQSDSHRGHWHENRGGFSTPNMSAVDLRAGANSQSSINLATALPRMPDLASLNRSKSGPSSIPANSDLEAAPTDVVCLSDDE